MNSSVLLYTMNIATQTRLRSCREAEDCHKYGRGRVTLLGDAAHLTAAALGQARPRCTPLHMPSSRLAWHDGVHAASIPILLLPSGITHNLEALATPASCHRGCKAVEVFCASTCLCKCRYTAMELTEGFRVHSGYQPDHGGCAGARARHGAAWSHASCAEDV